MHSRWIASDFGLECFCQQVSGEQQSLYLSSSTTRAESFGDYAASRHGAPPGPVDNRQIDMSINYNGPIGSDPSEVARQNGIQQDRAISRRLGRSTPAAKETVRSDSFPRSCK
jgi:hypothetical protein